MAGESMHPYSVTSSEREHVTCALLGVAILVTWAVTGFLVSKHIALPWWVESPSVATIFGLLYCLFDKHAWKCRVLHKVGIISTPNVNGVYVGYLKSSVDGCEKKQEAILNVRQCWTSISISLTANQSVSSSLVAAMVMETDDRTSLYYEYLNTPLPTAKDTMHVHRGSAQLTLKLDGNGTLMLQGQYYTGRDRQSYGSMQFSRDRAQHR